MKNAAFGESTNTAEFKKPVLDVSPDNTPQLD